MMNTKVSSSTSKVIMLVVLGVAVTTIGLLSQKGSDSKPRSLPHVSRANLRIVVVDRAGDRVTVGTIVAERTYTASAGIPGSTYEVDLAEVMAAGGLFYYEPGPTPQSLSLSVRLPSGETTGTFVVTNTEYWAAHAKSKRDYVVTVTLRVGDRSVQTLADVIGNP